VGVETAIGDLAASGTTALSRLDEVAAANCQCYVGFCKGVGG